MAVYKTTYSCGGVHIAPDEWDEPELPEVLDESVVVVREDARWSVYDATWCVLPEEKRLDLQNHARIAGSGSGDGALQGLDDLCTLFDEGDGYEDASIDLGRNALGTLGVEEVAARWRDERGSGHFVPAPPLTVFVAENILRNTEWGFSGLGLADNGLGRRSMLGVVRVAECLRDRFGTRFGTPLVALDLSGNCLLGSRGHRMAGMKALVKCMRRAPAPGSLERLSLARNELHHEGCRFLSEMLDGPGLGSLRVLDLSDNYLCATPDGAEAPWAFRALAASVLKHASLGALDLSRNGGFGDEAAEMLVHSGCEGLSRLRSLRLGGNPGCGARTARHLGAALGLSRSLTDVDLCDLDLPRPSLFDLVDCLPTATSVTALDLSGNGRAFLGPGADALASSYRAAPLAKLLEGVRGNTSLLTLRLCRLEYGGARVEDHELATVARSLVANACLPQLRANPFKWDLAAAGDAKHELLRKFRFLAPEEARKLRSNKTILGDKDARVVLDAVAPPTYRALMTEDPASLAKLDARNPYRKFAARRIQLSWFAHGHARDGEGPVDYASHMTPSEAAYERMLQAHRAAKAGGRSSMADLNTRKSNFWGKHVGPHRRASQKQGLYPPRKHTVGPHRRESQRSGMYPGDPDYDPADQARAQFDPRATALARMRDSGVWQSPNNSRPNTSSGAEATPDSANSNRPAAGAP